MRRGRWSPVVSNGSTRIEYHGMNDLDGYTLKPLDMTNWSVTFRGRPVGSEYPTIKAAKRAAIHHRAGWAQ